MALTKDEISKEAIGHARLVRKHPDQADWSLEDVAEDAVEEMVHREHLDPLGIDEAYQLYSEVLEALKADDATEQG